MSAAGEQWVYIFRRFDTDMRVYLHKIGVAWQPSKRARTCHAELLWVEEGGVRRERELHSLFGHLRILRGDFEGSTEWFLDEFNEISDYILDSEAA